MNITSKEVAKMFSKRHKEVLVSIRNRINEDNRTSDYFVATTYIDSQNKKQPMYFINKKGFEILAMAYRAKRHNLKRCDIIEDIEDNEDNEEEYIDFNEMINL